MLMQEIHDIQDSIKHIGMQIRTGTQGTDQVETGEEVGMDLKEIGVAMNNHNPIIQQNRAGKDHHQTATHGEVPDGADTIQNMKIYGQRQNRHMMKEPTFTMKAGIPKIIGKGTMKFGIETITKDNHELHRVEHIMTTDGISQIMQCLTEIV